MTKPTPALLANLHKRDVEPDPSLPSLPEPRLLAAVIDANSPAAHGKSVRPGTVEEEFWTHHDGVVKAKHLVPGQTVRPWLHGKPMGSARTVGSVDKKEDGAVVEIVWSSGHPTSEHKAAYRFHVPALVGTPVRSVRRVAALVEV